MVESVGKGDRVSVSNGKRIGYARHVEASYDKDGFHFQLRMHGGQVSGR